MPADFFCSLIASYSAREELNLGAAEIFKKPIPYHYATCEICTGDISRYFFF
jgi:hypothetical protein